MNESKGQGEKKKRGGRPKNAFGDGGRMVSNEVYKWAKKVSTSSYTVNNNEYKGGRP